ncbi:unnamed protein product [Medioppia subpectinata]|uniref:Uncharacterized protein n=1 Tax=Medioppia subpectinata TaxID=1979941 RepID=A0A7R9KP66_9ACAR|nr:unnamed protein product [Medioppia subpectinata]CAG2106912.1 unnamed protein product [Medioppia subpectinata]
MCEEMAIIMSSDSDEISPQTSPVIVDYNGSNGSAPNSPMSSNVSSNLNRSVLNSRSQPIVSAASLMPTVFGSADHLMSSHHLGRKQTPWYPWAVSSAVISGEHSHQQTNSAHQYLFRDYKNSDSVKDSHSELTLELDSRVMSPMESSDKESSNLSSNDVSPNSTTSMTTSSKNCGPNNDNNNNCSSNYELSETVL